MRLLHIITFNKILSPSLTIIILNKLLCQLYCFIKFHLCFLYLWSFTEDYKTIALKEVFNVVKIFTLLHIDEGNKVWCYWVNIISFVRYTVNDSVNNSVSYFINIYLLCFLECYKSVFILNEVWFSSVAVNIITKSKMILIRKIFVLI